MHGQSHVSSMSGVSVGSLAYSISSISEQVSPGGGEALATKAPPRATQGWAA